jgi:hypothetical protein
MNSPGKWWCLIGLGIVAALASRPARAADRPLLVVVEAPAALDADAAEIRRAIGVELRAETVAPMKTQADPPERALIVALDRDRIAMSLRTSDAAPVVRSIPSPPEHAARLRAITWLAGNLARDQVSPILAQLADAPPDPSPAVAPSPPSGVDRAPAPPAVPPATEPPGFETPAVTVASSPRSQPEQQARWTVSAAAGPAISTYGLGHALRQSIFGSWTLGNSLYDVFHQNTTVWRVDLRHHADASGTFTGLTLEGSGGNYYPQPDFIGAMALVGSGLRLGRWVLEGSLGAGIDLVQDSPAVLITTANGGVSTTYSETPSQTPESRAGLYAGGSVSVAHPVFGSMDAVLSLDVHLSVTSEYDGYIASMLGLRYRL